jgi:hypothetical protein
MSAYAVILRTIKANPGFTSAQLVTTSKMETATVLHGLIDLTQGFEAPVARTGTEGAGATYAAIAGRS